ncbi:membrane-associated protease 1 [Haliovirga abyssi]|uniref:Membrane-associated protease 1 n=1 Tax=Haliovirga abyssi TaxID=2996794 RepID=A0AAU9D3T7_9FUSO|nr:membrane-associated protease 1 [Haliovirga abyssi]BDU50636.1 hypothetical protein HLVA_12050 [Haliovirga abyssi]
MGFRLKVEGQNETIDLGMANIQKAEYKTDTPDDSNARSTDVGTLIIVTGKIITAVNGEEADHTLNLAKWSVVSAEKADCYRVTTLEVIAADQVVRKIILPNSFVVDYTEKYGDTEGVGTFEIVIKQKKDKTELTDIDGGFAQE